MNSVAPLLAPLYTVCPQRILHQLSVYTAMHAFFRIRYKQTFGAIITTIHE